MDNVTGMVLYNHPTREGLDTLFEGALELLTGWEVQPMVDEVSEGDQENVVAIFVVLDDEDEDGPDIFKDVRSRFPNTPIIWCAFLEDTSWLVSDPNAHFFHTEGSLPVHGEGFQKILRRLIAVGEERLMALAAK